MKIYDLIYLPLTESKELKQKYPDAIIEDASDEIHDGRFSISIEIEQRDYFKSLILLGYATASLMFSSTNMDTINSIIDEIKNDKISEVIK